jgi:inosine/xanthosine triphosphate pyrophosphatase family protein
MNEHKQAEIKALLDERNYTIQDVLDLFHDEVIEYAENEGYHYCDNCEERVSDPSDRDR